jgi:hypothetical protein
MKQRKKEVGSIDAGLKKNLIGYYRNKDGSPDYALHTRHGKKITRMLKKLNGTSANMGA